MKSQCDRRIETEKDILAKELEENKNCEKEIKMAVKLATSIDKEDVVNSVKF